MKDGVDGVGPSLQDQQVLLSVAVATFDQFLLQSQLQDGYGPQIKPTQTSPCLLPQGSAVAKFYKLKSSRLAVGLRQRHTLLKSLVYDVTVSHCDDELS